MEIFKKKTPQFDLDIDLSVPENMKKFENEVRSWWERTKKWRKGIYPDKNLEKQRLDLLDEAEQIRKQILQLPEIKKDSYEQILSGAWPFGDKPKPKAGDSRNGILQWIGNEEKIKLSEKDAYREGKIDKMLGISEDSDWFDKIRGILIVGSILVTIPIVGSIINKVGKQ